MLNNLCFIFPLIISVGALVLTCHLLGYLKKHHQAGRRSPLFHHKILKGPGENLRKQINNFSDDIIFDLFVIPWSIAALSPFYVALLLSLSQGKGENITRFLLFLVVPVNILIILYRWNNIRNTWKTMHNYLLGLDGELYTGYELNQLMRHGYHVFHGFEFEGLSNIDHIAVGAKGIFAIETKSVPKSDYSQKIPWWLFKKLPPKTNQKTHRVIYDGEKLKFPTWTNKDFLDQAKRNAKELSTWLQKKTNQKIWVTPVLSLPGWEYIQTAKDTKVLVYNGLNPMKLVGASKHHLDEKIIKRIAHELEAECKTVEPIAYMQNKKNQTENNQS